MDPREIMTEEGANRYNTLNLVQNPRYRNDLLDNLESRMHQVDVLIAIETLGIPIGSMLADRRDCQFTVLREKDKLDIPETYLGEKMVPYEDREKYLTLDRRTLGSDDTVAIVDDWIESGKQIDTAFLMLEDVGVDISCVITIGTDRDYSFPYDCQLLEYTD